MRRVNQSPNHPALLSALRQGAGPVAVLSPTGVCLFVSETGRRVLGDDPAALLRGLPSGTVGTEGARAISRLLAALMSGASPSPVPLGPEPDAPFVSGVRHTTDHGALLVLRVLPPTAPQPRALSAGRDALVARVAADLEDPALVPLVVTLELANHDLVHDSLGPASAESFLLSLEHRLADAVDASDRLARLDGPVFAAVLPLAHRDEAAVRTSALVERINAPCRVGDRAVQPVIRAGFALPDQRHAAPADLLRDAAIARRRTDRVRPTSPQAFVATMQRESRLRLELETALPGAAARGELELHYQPVVELGTLRLAGFEALLRWRRPEGLLTPDSFVPLAEESGLIRELGAWVLQSAIEQVARWANRGLGNPRLSVNISPLQLGEVDLAPRVEGMLRRAGVPPDTLEIEVTESLLIEAPSPAARTMTALRSLGVRTAIDDFGTGYASLEQLHRYPFDVLKLDRYFVQRLPGHPQDRRVVQTMRTLAASLGMELVAEGVETDDQRAFLAELGCERAQGYLFGRPMAADDAAGLLRENPRWSTEGRG